MTENKHEEIRPTGQIPIYFNGDHGKIIEIALRTLARDERRKVNDQLLLIIEKGLKAEGRING